MTPAITAWADDFASAKGRECCLSQDFYWWRDSNAYTAVKAQGAGCVPGALYITSSQDPIDVSRIGEPDDRVRIIARYRRVVADAQGPPLDFDAEWDVKGYVLREGQWQEGTVQVLPLERDLHSRARGILDSCLLRDARVLAVGLGSVGSVVPVSLTESGVSRFTLVDDDIVSVSNVARGNFYIQDVGRRKTHVVRERILGKNPYASVETHQVRIGWGAQEFVRDLVRPQDLVIAAVDNQEARRILNVVCVEEKKPAIFMGASHRGGELQILFVRRPGIDPCYQCFLMSLPKSERTRGLGRTPPRPYTDYEVPQFEPGLSVDLAPMNTMVTKLCIQKLLEGKATALRSLDDDLTAPLYLYLNRREGPYEKLAPLGFNVGDALHILAWCGIDLRRDPGCPTCGDDEMAMSKRLAG